jgi:mannan endo-1,4-beta-mannosidase
MKITTFLLGLLLVVSIGACEKTDRSEEITDHIPPEVVSTQPLNGAAGVQLPVEIIITYSEKIILGNSHQITVNNKTADANVDGTQLFINAALRENTDYTVSVSGISILDLAKNYATEFSFSFSTKIRQPVNISDKLATLNPSKEAVNVYQFLKENYGRKLISSAMANVSWNLNEAEWVKQQTGKYPAMATFDFIHLPYSPASWIDYSDTGFIEDWWNNNGLVSAGWHWNVPSYQGSDEYHFYTDQTSFRASNATVEGSWENEIVKADLEEIAGYLQLLQEKNIPVIWRPLHEAAGNIYEFTGGTAWFWWGADGAEAYKKLWIYMFEYFNNQGLNNLIWVWTTQTGDHEFYPGDEYVDMIGRDIYNHSDANAIAEEFLSIQNSYPNKMVALSELGNTATISSQWEAGANWSYFMPWYDYERTNNLNEPDFNEPGHQYANTNWWTDAFNQSYVIARHQMPNLK